MRRTVFALFLAAGLAAPAAAQTTGTPEDHDALRKLKADVVTAINARDHAKTGQLLARPFMATVITQESFTELDRVKAYFDSLFTRSFLAIRSIRIEAEADDFATIREGTFAFAKGGTKERYEMADGRVFDMAGRWTAVAQKQDGAWKIASIHSGVNFLDNPVIGAIEKSVVWFGAGGLAAGALAGFLLGWLTGRRGAARRA